jgi:hypothetical protein
MRRLKEELLIQLLYQRRFRCIGQAGNPCKGIAIAGIEQVADKDMTRIIDLKAGSGGTLDGLSREIQLCLLCRYGARM